MAAASWPGSARTPSTHRAWARPDGPARLAACCAVGDLAGAVEAVEHLVGLGPGLVPSGDSMVSGVLLALRLLGGAISGGTRAVWLANWLSASATCYAAQRTTHAGRLAAALRGQRPGGGGGIRRAAGDGGAGAARARGGPAARDGPGRGPGVGPGGRLAARRCCCPYPDAVTVPLTGQQYQIEAGPYRATVTELGAGPTRTAVARPAGDRRLRSRRAAPAGAGQLLAPWPNRIDGGQYAFGGTEFHLALTEPARGNAIHGLTRWTAWTPVSHDVSSVVLRSAPHGWQGYPFCVEIEAEYRLEADSGLQVTVTARNRGSHAGPVRHRLAPVPDRRHTVGRRLRAGPARRRPGCPSTIAASPSGPAAAVEGTPYDFRQPRPIGATQLDRRADRAGPGPGRPGLGAPERGASGADGLGLGLGARRPGSACGPGTATAGCRYSPATRWDPSAAARRWPSSR